MLYLLGGSGLIIFASGIWLAHAGHRYFQRSETTDCVAGLLMMAGLGCLGTGLGLCLGSPLH
jgi:hypothetical protein